MNVMGNEYTEIIDLGVSVADAEDLKFEYNCDYLKVSFIDWREKGIQLSCSDVIAIRWQRAEYHIDENERFDSALAGMMKEIFAIPATREKLSAKSSNKANSADAKSRAADQQRSAI